MTGQSTFGELHGGKMQRCSLLLSKSLTKPDCRLVVLLFCVYTAKLHTASCMIYDELGICHVRRGCAFVSSL